MPAYLARTGLVVFAMLFALALLTKHVAADSALVAGTSSLDLPPLHEVAAISRGLDMVLIALAVAGSQTAPAETAAATAAALAPAATVPALGGDAIVLASWYGPGFYGNLTACGQTYTPEILGVAHLTLPCGTALTLTYGSHSVTVTVIDRGPYIAGREWDLTGAAAEALHFPGLGPIEWKIG